MAASAPAPAIPKIKGKGKRKAAEAARDALLKKLKSDDDKAAAAANMTAIQAAVKFLDAVAELAQSGVVFKELALVFHTMLKDVEPSCTDVRDFKEKLMSVDAAVSALPRWEVWFWMTYERYEEMQKELSADEKDLPADEKDLPADEKDLPADEKDLPADEKDLPADVEGDVGCSVESPRYAPTSPCYTRDCCIGSKSVVDSSIVTMIEDMLAESRSDARSALGALRACGTTKNQVTLQAIIDRLVTRFTQMTSYLALSLDLEAYARITEEEYKGMPHWERGFVGTYGSYQRLLEQLQRAKQ